MEFRPAVVDDVDVLVALVLDGVAHRGRDIEVPDAVAGLRADGLPDASFVEANTVEVLLDRHDVAGFHGLARRGDHVELVHVFVAVDQIGTGCGRRLWERAVARARGSRASDADHVRSGRQGVLPRDGSRRPAVPRGAPRRGASPPLLVTSV